MLKSKKILNDMLKSKKILNDMLKSKNILMIHDDLNKNKFL